MERKGEAAIVVFDRPTACGECKGCFGDVCTRVELTVDAEVGDIIDVEMPDRSILSASAMAYLIPLALLLTGLLGGTALHGPLALPLDVNLFAAIAGFLLLAVGLAIVRIIDRSLRLKRQWQPRVLRVYKKEH